MKNKEETVVCDNITLLTVFIRFFHIQSFFWKTWSCQYNCSYHSCQHLAVYRKACSRTFSSCFRLLSKCFYPTSLLGNIFPFRFLHFVLHWRLSVIFTVPSHSSCILKRAILISCYHFAFVIHFHQGSGRKGKKAFNMKLK